MNDILDEDSLALLSDEFGSVMERAKNLGIWLSVPRRRPRTLKL